MKTMKLGDIVKRVDEKNVEQMLKQGWNYCSKKLWKDNFRVIKETVKVEKKEEKDNRNLKGKAKKNN